MQRFPLIVAAILAAFSLTVIQGFVPQKAVFRNEMTFLNARRTARKISENEVQNRKISATRRQKLGIADDEDEYDLGIALDSSTDPFITKAIAGSLILTITALLIAGIVIPATTDYGEGVCNILLTGGRC